MPTHYHARHFGKTRPTLADLAVRPPETLAFLRQRGAGFQPLPPPTRTPFEMDLAEVLPPEVMKAIHDAGRMRFHIAGDTGGVKDPVPQQLVANCMEDDYRAPQVADRPAFFYHLGDVVYFNGERSEYYSQFYMPYEHYPGPIFSIPGNHDGEPLPGGEPTLAAWVDNFCADTPRKTAESGEDTRDAMTEPNPFWTLHTPFATFLGLYSNVPEGGEIRQDQQDWFADQLTKADTAKPVFVCVHHPLFSLDTHHSGSSAMQEVIAKATSRAGRMPEMIFTAHVHNYQRFTWQRGDAEVPVLVAGAAGYHNLHYVARNPNGDRLAPPVAIPELQITLEQYLDDRHGYLLLDVTASSVHARYYGTPRPQESWRGRKQLIDEFEFDWRARRLVRPAAIAAASRG